MRTLVSLLCLLAFCPAASAQDLHFERIHLPGGGYVTDITQDRHGYMWFATSQGLIRHDGYEFALFSHAPLDSSSLSSDYVESLYIDGSGTLWVGTYGGGLNRFDAETQTFKSYRRDPNDPHSLSSDSVTVMVEDRDGVLWVGTNWGGLNRFDRETERFARYRHDPADPTSLAHDEIRALYVDRPGTLWVGTRDFTELIDGGADAEGALNRFDRASETFVRHQHDPNDVRSLIANPIRSIFEDSGGNFWVGTAGGGVHKMDRERGTFIRYRYDPESSDWLSKPSPQGPERALGVSFIREDGSGTIWIGLYGSGVTRYDPTTGVARNYVPKAGDPTTIDDFAVWTVHESRDGVLWIGTLGGNLYKVDPLRSRFHLRVLETAGLPSLNGVTSMVEDEGSIYWIGTMEGGLVRYDRGTGSVRHYLHNPDDPASLSNNYVLEVYLDGEGMLWVGTSAGLDRFDSRHERFLHYRHDPSDSRSLGSGWVESIYEDRKGRFWVGTRERNLNLMDRTTGTFTRFAPDPSDASSLSPGPVNTIIEDRHGRLWIGTRGGGLSRFDPESGRFRRYLPTPGDPASLSSAFVYDIDEDNEGILTIATGAGFDRLDPENEAITHFTAANTPLAGKLVWRIVGGDDGTLWLSTDTGVVQFTPADTSFQTFGVTHGLEPGTLAGPLLRTRNGDLLVGARNGFYALDPEALRTNPHPPDVAITAFRRISGSAADAATMRTIRSEDIPLRLAHDENDFAFEYLGFHFSSPGANRYRYMLEGYDDAWRESGTLRSASYYKVQPGRYTFRVRAASVDGVWSEELASMALIVLPPWWRTWWAYAAYGLMLVGGVFAVDRIQRRRLIKRERDGAKMEQARIRAEAAERELQQAREIEKAYH
ncbi:MAG: two-component regulator propeller domain-containing protein, partial [Rhodothermales bacterium]